MFLRGYLKDKGISGDKIVESVRIINEICRSNILCVGCLFYHDDKCVLGNLKSDSLTELTRNLVQESMTCGYMDRVADILNVKLDKPFDISYSGFHIKGCVLTTEGLMLSYKDESYEVDSVLRELLIGKAKVRGERKDESML